MSLISEQSVHTHLRLPCIHAWATGLPSWRLLRTVVQPCAPTDGPAQLSSVVHCSWHCWYMRLCLLQSALRRALARLHSTLRAPQRAPATNQSSSHELQMQAPSALQPVRSTPQPCSCRYEEDVGLAKKLGVNSFRLSIEWHRIEVRPRVYDQDAIRRCGPTRHCRLCCATAGGL